jgi:hypothetical protein
MKKEIRIHWLTNTFTIAVILALIGGIYFPFGYINKWSQEPRSKLMIALDNGGLFWGVLTFIFLLATIALFIHKRYVKLLLSTLVLLCSATMFYFSVVDLQPYYKDIAVFQNEDNKQEKLIIQYYETGITGNPQKRMIKTKNMESAIRDIETIPVPAVIDTLYSYWDIKESLPKLYVDKQDTFLLKEVLSLYNE